VEEVEEVEEEGEEEERRLGIAAGSLGQACERRVGETNASSSVTGCMWNWGDDERVP
jgi:hypothetical protein